MKSLLAFSAALLLASCATTQQPLQPEAAGKTLQPISTPKPVWPKEAKDFATVKKPVVVVIKFDVTAAGNVENARIVSSNDPRFNAAALNVGRRMKFAPKAGRPTLQAQKPIIFTHPDLPSKPSPGPKTGSVMVVFSIGADGHVKNAHPEKPADPVLDRLAVEILSTSKFPPAKTPAEQAQKKRVLVTVKN